MKLRGILTFIIAAALMVLPRPVIYAETSAAADQRFGVTGVVTSISGDSITVLSKEKERVFSLDGAEIKYSGGILPEDVVKIIYGSRDKESALEVRMVTPSKAHSRDIYDIQGTAKAISGSQWADMLTWRQNAKRYAEKYRDAVRVNREPAGKAVYLTFDDGPDASNTSAVINCLVKYKAGGTFFFTGEGMRTHSAVVKSAHDNGFTIGLHGYGHTRFSKMSEAELQNDVNKTNGVFYGITGKYSSLTRPPYGDINDSAINTLSAMGQQVCLWSIDTLDWAQSDSSGILRNIKENLRPGDIILMHSGPGKALSVRVLPQIIEYVRSQGYEPANLSA